MRRRDLSDQELTRVINLRQAGASWVKIQHETGINRRTAKRAYDKWERSKSMGELREARKDVAAQAFREHMNALITLAVSLVLNLRLPHLPDMMTTDGEQFLPRLWQQDLLQCGDYISSEPVHVYTMGDPGAFYIRDMQLTVRRNELLFECLQVHTRENVRWNVLDEWKKARTKCVKVRDKLWKQTRQVVNNFLNQERQTNLLHSIKEESRQDAPVERMAEAVLRAIWQGILSDKLDQEYPFETVSRGSRTAPDIVVKMRDQIVLGFNTNMSLAEKVTCICNLAVSNLRKGDMVQQLHDEVHRMKKASDELHEMLNPLRLLPMILRTRCDLCPA